MKLFGFNTVEGWNLRLAGTYEKYLPGRKVLSLSPVLRYGFNNGHFNAYITGNYRFGKSYVNELTLSGGKRVIQFNNSNQRLQQGKFNGANAICTDCRLR